MRKGRERGGEEGDEEENIVTKPDWIEALNSLGMDL